MTYSDETLVDFLNGNLDPAQVRAIESELLVDKDLEKRLMGLDPMAKPVRDAFMAIPSSARLTPIRQLMLTESPTRSFNMTAFAAMAATLIFGVLIGSFWDFGFRSEQSNWRHEVARYQALYVNETVANLTTAPNSLNEQFKRASEKIGAEIRHEPLDQIEGLELKRAQILGYQGQALIQIAFRDANGTPFALCVLKGKSKDQFEETMVGLASQSWGDGRYEFILIGGTDQNAIDRYSKALKATGFLAS